VPTHDHQTGQVVQRQHAAAFNHVPADDADGGATSEDGGDATAPPIRSRRAVQDGCCRVYNLAVAHDRDTISSSVSVTRGWPFTDDVRVGVLRSGCTPR
jgi:hypothetical protein